MMPLTAQADNYTASVAGGFAIGERAHGVRSAD